MEAKLNETKKKLSSYISTSSINSKDEEMMNLKFKMDLQKKKDVKY